MLPSFHGQVAQTQYCNWYIFVHEPNTVTGIYVHEPNTVTGILIDIYYMQVHEPNTVTAT